MYMYVAVTYMCNKSKIFKVKFSFLVYSIE